MYLFTNMVGRKMVMSISGLAMVLFVILHLLGNTSIFAGPDGINAYAMMLRGLTPFLWIMRLVMFTAVCLHAFFGVRLSLENHYARPEAYAVKKNIRSTFTGRNMIWTGAFIASYLVFHLLHFTLHVISPGLSAGGHGHMDELGRPDVYLMVVSSFRHFTVSVIYISAMAALALHLYHGIQSLFQTLGLNTEKTLHFFVRAGAVAAIILSLGFISIPLGIFAGIVRH